MEGRYLYMKKKLSIFLCEWYRVWFEIERNYTAKVDPQFMAHSNGLLDEYVRFELILTREKDRVAMKDLKEKLKQLAAQDAERDHYRYPREVMSILKETEHRALQAKK